MLFVWVGENGVTSFYAISVTGDTVVIRLVERSFKDDTFTGFDVVISEYLEDYPNE